MTELRVVRAPTLCGRCTEPHPAVNGMAPWDYYHDCANLGKYDDCDVACTYRCACDWLDSRL